MSHLIFFGSSPFSVTVLQKLISSKKYPISAVVTTPDKPVGRHLKLTPNPVKVLALQYHIPVVEKLSELQVGPDSIGLVAAFGRIIKSEILDKFSDRLYNIHPSLLPKYRGPSPLQQQILDGITETGVSIIQLDAQMDHGPQVAVTHDKILNTDTTTTLGERLFTLGTELFLSLNLSQLTPTVQDETQATYTQKLTREDGFIPWGKFIKFDYPHKFRALHPWPGVWTTNPEGKRMKLISLTPQILVQLEGKSPFSFFNSANATDIAA